MRKSVLSRSLITAVSLAVASVAFSAVPATAATASGITRDEVLAAAAARAGTDPESMPLAVRALANRACAVDPNFEFVYLATGYPTQTGDDAEGLLLAALIVDLSAIGGESSSAEDPMRWCAFGALAATDPSYSLTGTATLDYLTTSTHALSGDVYVTPARSLTLTDLENIDESQFRQPSFAASGNATKVIPTKVSTPKTAKQKKAAKKVQAKALKSAKKSYTKAIKKAGKNKKKKAAAKKAYAKKKAAAKAKYKLATATFKIVNNTDARPFSISAVIPVQPQIARSVE